MLTCQQCGFDQWKARTPNPLRCSRCLSRKWNEPKKAALPPLKCRKCGFGAKGEWKPRVKNPSQCPRCKQDWTKPKVVPLPQLTCRRCGKRWTPIVKNPVVCRRCKMDWRNPKLSSNNTKEKA